MSSNKVINFFALISSVMVGIDSQKYCVNTDPLETIFTMGDYTYAKKGHRYYETKVGQTLNSGRDFDLDTLFKKGGNVKLMTINTGFMITKTPNCSTVAKDVTEICNEMQKKLLNKVFVIGRTALVQQYITYIYENITRGTYKTLTPVTDNNRMPSYMKFGGDTTGPFWPIQDNSNAEIMRSVFDERSYSIVHIVVDKTKGRLNLYSYSLLAMEATPKFDISRDEETIQKLNDEITILGFVKTPQKDGDPMRNIYAIAKSKIEDIINLIVLHFELNFRFSTSPDIDLEHIDGCPNSSTTTTTTTTSTTTTTTTPTPTTTTPTTAAAAASTTTTSSTTTTTTTPQPKTSESDVTSSTDSGGGKEGDDGKTTPSTSAKPESSSSWIWILVIIVIGIILLLAVITAVFFLAKNKEKPIPPKDKDQEKVEESNQATDN